MEKGGEAGGWREGLTGMEKAGGWQGGLTGMEKESEGGKGRPQQVSLCSAQALYAVAQSILVQGTTKQRN